MALSEEGFSQQELESLVAVIDGVEVKRIIQVTVQEAVQGFWKSCKLELIAIVSEAVSQLYKEKLDGKLDSVKNEIKECMLAAIPSGSGGSTNYSCDLDAGNPDVGKMVVMASVTSEEEGTFVLEAPHGIYQFILGRECHRSVIREILSYVYKKDAAQLGMLFLCFKGNVLSRYPRAQLLPVKLEKAIIAFLKDKWFPSAQPETIWNKPLAKDVKRTIGVVLAAFRDAAKLAGHIEEARTLPRTEMSGRIQKLKRKATEANQILEGEVNHNGKDSSSDKSG